MDVSPSSRSEEKRKLKEEIMMDIKRFQQKKLREEIIKELIREGQIPLQDRDEILTILMNPVQLPEIVLVDHQTESADLRTPPFQRYAEATTLAVVKPVFNLCDDGSFKPLSIIPPGAGGGVKHKLESVAESDDDTKNPVKDWSCDICKVKVMFEYQLKDHQDGQKHKRKFQSMEAAKDTVALRQPPPAIKRLAVGEETVDLDQELPSKAGIHENLAVAAAIKNYFVGFEMRTPLLNPHQSEPKAEKSVVHNPVINHRKEPVCSIQPRAAVAGAKRKLESVTETEEEPNSPFRNDNKKLIECDICKIQVTGEASFQRHVKGKKHYSKCAKAFSQLPPCQEVDLVVKDFAQKVGPVADEVSKKAPVNGQESWVRELCNARVGSEDHKKTHLNGRRHASNATAKQMVLFGEDPPLSGQKEWRCDLCNVRVLGERNKIAHLEGKRHTLKAAKETATLSQPPPDKEAGPAVEIQGAYDAKELLCKMCNFVGVSKEEVSAHKSGNAHLRLFLTNDRGVQQR